MSANLNEFSTYELALLLLAVEYQIQTCQNNLERVSRFDESELKTNQEQYWNKQLEAYNLWQVQIMNAAAEVKIIQTPLNQ